ncbi:MAG: acetyl-CoA synthase, partial [Thermodesulfobacteriota bacterium]
AEAEAKAAAAAEAKAKEEAKAKDLADLNELRRKRAEERLKHLAEKAACKSAGLPEGATPGKGREPGTAGPDASFIYKSLDRWSLRGPGHLK